MLAARSITKRYPGTQALDGVDFRLLGGEIGALMGENGAGKSTLIKILTGVEAADSGTIEIDGRAVSIDSPKRAAEIGIAVVYQELELIPGLSIAENITLGRERTRYGLVSTKDARRRAKAALDRLGLAVDLDADLAGESTAVMQMVAIARALAVEARVLILDEPTASLDLVERRRLFEVLRKLRSEGMAVLFVTHFIEEVYELADRVTVFRNGKRVDERTIDRWPRKELIAAMLGRPAETVAKSHAQKGGDSGSGAAPVCLSARSLSRVGALVAADVDLRVGRVTGMAGLLGSGRTETARLLFGADAKDGGIIEYRGEPLTKLTPRRAVALGFAFSPENRKIDGIVPDLSIRENIILALQARRGVTSRLPDSVADQLTRDLMSALRIKASGPEVLVRTLSGGNQQKVILARWLALEPTVFILDEPTRGIDVGAKEEVAALVKKLASDGAAVLFISSEIEEVTALSDEIVVMRDRTSVTVLASEDIAVDDIITAIAGAAHE